MLTLADAATAIDREMRRALDILEAPTTSWTSDTRLPGWSVADLATHLAFGQSLQADAWGALRQGGHDAIAPRADLPAGADASLVLDAIRSSADRLQEQLRAATDADLGNVVTMPYGPVPGALLLQLAVMEAGVHTSDLSHATGGDDALADDVVSASFVVLATFLPVLGQLAAASGAAETFEVEAVRLEAPAHTLTVRRADEGWTLADGRAGDTVVRGAGSELVLFALGRRTGETPALAVTGDGSILQRFKDLFPGP